VTVSLTLLGMLECSPSHGSDLKRAHDELFPGDRPLAYGRVYSTLARLLKNGLVEVNAIEAGDGPDRKEVRGHRRRSPERPQEYLQKAAMREFTSRKQSGDHAD
jgi:DNA-binding PadR family transcriptional regulator